MFFHSFPVVCACVLAICGVGFRLSILFPPFSCLPSRIFFWLFPFSSALRSLAARPSSARLSSFPTLPQMGCFHFLFKWGVFTSYSIIHFPGFPPLVTVMSMTPFLLLFSVSLRISSPDLFLLLASFPCFLRFLSPVCSCFPIVFCFLACVLSSFFSIIAQLGFSFVLFSLVSPDPHSWLLLAHAVGSLPLHLG